MTAVVELPVDRIVAGTNDRKSFDPVKLAELAASIAEHGLAQPITVRPVGERYEIVAGERRFRAIARVLGRPTAPCLVKELSDAEASAVMLLENLARVDLDAIEEARAYRTRADRFGSSLEEIAALAGVSPDRVRRRLNLLRLVDEAQHLVARGQLPLGHGEAMSALDENRQRIALRILQQRDGIPLATFRQIVGGLVEQQSQEGLFDLESFWSQQVADSGELVRSGKRAVTGSPKRPDLPPCLARPTDSAGKVFDRYIAELLAAGHTAEAGALGNIYEALVRGTWTSVPIDSQLLSAAAKE
jgi:ParB family chromosome partitioning protein